MDFRDIYTHKQNFFAADLCFSIPSIATGIFFGVWGAIVYFGNNAHVSNVAGCPMKTILNLLLINSILGVGLPLLALCTKSTKVLDPAHRTNGYYGATTALSECARLFLNITQVVMMILLIVNTFGNGAKCPAVFPAAYSAVVTLLWVYLILSTVGLCCSCACICCTGILAALAATLTVPRLAVEEIDVIKVEEQPAVNPFVSSA